MNTVNSGVKDASALTRWVRYCLYAQIVLAIIAMFSGWLEYQLLQNFQQGFYSSEQAATADAIANDARQRVVGLLYLVVFIVSGFLILKWIHRVSYNAKQLTNITMEFSPGWSVGWFFIPVFSLWKPYQAMSEIWQVSESPQNVSLTSSSLILPLWWFCWLVNNFFSQYLFRQMRKMDNMPLPELLNLNLLGQAGEIITIALAVVTLILVNRIYQFQQRAIIAAKERSANELQQANVAVGF
ncbi:DUF4328 domain-containing protein [Rheinheimera oceanensis]|uniref:DUF4328 domain-containing protein n=1 Tax=Rheinheimera oceanensis TaxID=2817449 RepID=UPI001BFE306F